MRKVVALGIVGALALGVGSAAGSSASGLRGRVMRGPTMPVCRVGVPCEAPARGLKLVFYRSGKPVKTATTNDQGWYRVTLRSGPIRVRTTRAGDVVQPVRTIVPSGRVKRFDIHIDTGIR